ncbi:MAG: ParB N-terminal domain-containing protein [Deltaproteobacteria bacterium]|nr:ParB N-terminal domain-containing protein [Deltaproteobacteria bacterium]
MEKIMQSKCQWMAVNRIKTRVPFNNLFPVDDKTVEALAEHMEANGYDQSQPIVLWKEKLDEDRKQAIVVDGHTRLLAAKKIGLSPVYVARVSFGSQDAALQYAIHNQRDRRNLTDADLLRCIEAVDERKPKGQRTDLASSEAKSGKSAEQTAKIVGTSKTKVEKARTLLDYADEQTKQTVLDGEKSIHAAAKETQEKRKVQQSGESQLSSTIQKINHIANRMKSLYKEIRAIKPIVKRYYKKPVANEENTKIIDNFSHWCWKYEDITKEIAEAKRIAITEKYLLRRTQEASKSPQDGRSGEGEGKERHDHARTGR